MGAEFLSHALDEALEAATAPGRFHLEDQDPAPALTQCSCEPVRGVAQFHCGCTNAFACAEGNRLSRSVIEHKAHRGRRYAAAPGHIP